MREVAVRPAAQPPPAMSDATLNFQLGQQRPPSRDVTRQPEGAPADNSDGTKLVGLVSNYGYRYF